MEYNYNFFDLSMEEYLRRFEEETITIDIDFSTDNIAEELAKEKEIEKYIRSFKAYNNI